MMKMPDIFSSDVEISLRIDNKDYVSYRILHYTQLKPFTLRNNKRSSCKSYQVFLPLSIG
ncbi:hypothetical protein GCM10027180_11140 [Microbulbifer echini]